MAMSQREFDALATTAVTSLTSAVRAMNVQAV